MTREDREDDAVGARAVRHLIGFAEDAFLDEPDLAVDMRGARVVAERIEPGAGGGGFGEDPVERRTDHRRAEAAIGGGRHDALEADAVVAILKARQDDEAAIGALARRHEHGVGRIGDEGGVGFRAGLADEPVVARAALGLHQERDVALRGGTERDGHAAAMIGRSASEHKIRAG